ncbi:hypothetical protein KOW79_017233 [Hemibagrus wyckioides]|uniref:Uncharacterized protein n=1 Tax=Hemibagrus wyckioides TaxID=337641 RepID=A0A9D3NA99_9TELE|nr:hypothetical protein KOW79_017233 [Hemibagrus wyckioides]
MSVRITAASRVANPPWLTRVSLQREDRNRFLSIQKGKSECSENVKWISLREGVWPVVCSCINLTWLSEPTP